MLRLLLTSGLVAFFSLQDSSEVDRLILSLGSESVDVRQKAEDRLIELGNTVLPALRRAAAGSDQEVRARAQSAIDDIDRLEHELQHDAAEKARLLALGRKDREKKEEKQPGAFFTGAARIELSTTTFQKGLVLHTDAVNYLYLEGRWEDILIDVVAVLDNEGKTLELERCGRCSPHAILVKDTIGPLKAHIKGTHRWYSTYVVEFSNPKNGDQKKVGDFTIQIDWPVLKVTTRHPRAKDVMERVGDSFTVKVKEGIEAPQARIGVVSGTSSGGGKYSGSTKWWCSCQGGPKPGVEKAKPELLRKLDATGGNEYRLDQLEAVRYTFFKPIEETLDFTADAPKE